MKIPFTLQWVWNFKTIYQWKKLKILPKSFVGINRQIIEWRIKIYWGKELWDEVKL